MSVLSISFNIGSGASGFAFMVFNCSASMISICQSSNSQLANLAT